jgi:rRNA methylases
MTPERFQRINDVLNKRQPDLTVVTDEVHKVRNISAIVRTCDAVGIDQIHCVTPKAGFQTYSGTSASADKWVGVNAHTRVAEPLALLKQQGFQVVAAHLDSKAVDYRLPDYTKPTALLLGAEIDGVSEIAQGFVDHTVVVPMMGMVESFNVSVAGAIILMEAQRQRQAAGLYDNRRIDDETFRLRFFRWAHPVITRFCDDFDFPYPAVREDGEIINLSAWYAQARKQAAEIKIARKARRREIADRVASEES